MKIYEATNRRIQELRKGRRSSEYALVYRAAMLPPIVKSILHGKSTNPGIVNIRKMVEGLDMAIREFYDSEIFGDLKREG